ncbi:MAG: GDSL-type esterase/lipase family protein [Coriobacteriales bacterium]
MRMWQRALSVLCCAVLALGTCLGPCGSALAAPAQSTSASAKAPAKSAAKDKAAKKKAAKKKAAKKKAKKKHVHKGLEVPISANLASLATSSSPALYHYVCACGKKLAGTYASGYPLTKSLDVLRERYASSPEGGIALFGSSYFSKWASAAADLEHEYGFDPAMVYNYGIGGSGIELWTSEAYLDLVASKKPSVVAIHGINDLRYYPTRPDYRSDAQAVRESFEALKSYVAGLQRRLPQARILLVSAFKTPSEYLREGSYGTSCISWRRIDLYNAQLSSFAQARQNVDFVDIERYLLAEDRDPWGNTRVRFYCNGSKLADASSLMSVPVIAWLEDEGGKPCPYFRPDLHHASRLAYTTIWTSFVGGPAVEFAQQELEALKAQQEQEGQQAQQAASEII